MVAILVNKYTSIKLKLINVVDGKLGIKAMEVYGERREHAKRRHKDACEKLVGYLR